ncbi:MAG: glycoside hydrolase family 125 protein [Mycoplasmatales bacterium]
MKIINNKIPDSMKNLIDDINEIYVNDKKIGEMFESGIKNTYQTTIKKDGKETFVITGDIPAMWNRDSVAQIRPLLSLVNEDEEIKKIIKGLIKIQQKQIKIDPYANAFNFTEGEAGDHCDDITDMHPMVWERKYEVDSLCYPIQLAYQYFSITKDGSIFDENFLEMVNIIVDTFITEQNHLEKSNYSFRRIADWLLFNEPERIEFETLKNKGKGSNVGYTGMTWSGFRPSDDACKYGYLIPSNMFAVVVMGYLEEILNDFYNESLLLKKVKTLKVEIKNGIEEYGTFIHPEFGKIFAYEVNGLGNQNFMDDANVPSLLSAPYLGFCDINDEVYQNTRKFLLSKNNPYYYEGSIAKGIGSAHTPPDYIWHIALAIQGMTSNSKEEQNEILEMFKKTDAGTNMMHEGVYVNDPNKYTRPWFSWANSMFAEFIMKINNKNLV